MRYNIPLSEARVRLNQRRSFRCNGTLRGERGAPCEYGQLTGRWVQFIVQFRRHIIYTVYSYQTPIVWVMDDGRVIVPPLRHSVTTRRHVRALGVSYTEEM